MPFRDSRPRGRAGLPGTSRNPRRNSGRDAAREPEETGERTRLPAAQNGSRSQEGRKAQNQTPRARSPAEISEDKGRNAMTAPLLDLTLARRIELAEVQAAHNYANDVELL